MNFKEFLKEDVAGVYHNSDKTLAVISDLVKDTFDLEFKGDNDGRCLLSQAIFTMSAVSKIPAEDIAASYKKEISYSGLTLEQIFNHFKKTTIVSNGKKYKFDLQLDGYDDIPSVISAVKSGQPVVMIVRALRDIAAGIEELEYDQKKTGKIPRDRVIDAAPIEYSKLFHALLLIGYDIKEKYLIGRDVKHTYGLKGYFKIGANHLKKNMKAVKFFGVVVNSVKEVK
jgi:hypothetical protein